MATGGLYGSTATATVVNASTETVGLYGNTTNFGGTYFEWFVFQQAATAPSTPTGGTWNFNTNVGTPPSGWSNSIPALPTQPVWVSIAFVNSKTPNTIVWSVPGVLGSQGPSGTLAVGTTTTGAAGTSASVTNSGTSTAAVFNFTIPRGDKGNPGDAATITAGTTTTGAAGSSASVTNSGTTSAAVFNFTIPKGDQGNPGDAATIAVGTTTTGAAGTSAIVTNSGTSSAATFNFTIPRGNTGNPATVTTGTTTTGAAGTSASVTNSGTTTDAVFNFTIPRGDKGDAATIAVGTTTTGAAGTSASVTNSGTSSAATFNFTIPQGAKGDTGAGVPVGGTTGQALVKNSATNYDTTWGNVVSAITSSDGSISIVPTGTSIDLAVSAASPASTLLVQVRNTTGATLTKGTVVYISGATGQIPTVSKALATSDATSAQTQGLITADIANNSNGYVTIIGLVTDIDTSAYSDGQQLYLSTTTAGTMTGTKVYAPGHLVYVGVVTYAHPVHGKIQVKVQNGYELDELHNVSAQTPSNLQTIIYNSTTSLWESNFIANGSLANSSLTVGSTAISLGGTASSLAGLSSVTVTADPTLALQLATKQYVDAVGVYTAGTGLSLTTKQFSIDSTVVTLTGTQTLTNKTLTGAAMNGTIGATTPSTGVFTSVTATSGISGGTF